APGPVSIGVNPTVLAPGGQSATITFRTAQQSVSVGVSYIINEPGLSPSPAQLTFTADSGDSLPATQNVTMTTQGNSPVSATTSVRYGSTGGAWLSLPTSGNPPGTLTLGVNTTNLNPGFYQAQVIVATATKNIPITVTYVLSQTVLTLSPP